ncbi:MAG: hypothetical protein Q7S51_04895 [Gallionellaceae bacterium]|nr:hypothetical protein [Gallionellaceae bacterium]
MININQVLWINDNLAENIQTDLMSRLPMPDLTPASACTSIDIHRQIFIATYFSE